MRMCTAQGLKSLCQSVQGRAVSDKAHERVHVTGSELLAEEERKPVGKASVPGEHCGDCWGDLGDLKCTARAESGALLRVLVPQN